MGHESARVRLLGEPGVLVDGRIIQAVVSPRLLSLLGLLVVHRATLLARQRVAFTLWPDSSEAQARTNLATRSISCAARSPTRPGTWISTVR